MPRLAYAIVRRAQRLLHLAARDRLTGVYNRGHFDATLAHEAQHAVRNGQKLTIAVLDLDHFKRINDTLGHPAGDKVLIGIAARLRQGMRSTDVIARYGGEEFAVLFPRPAVMRLRYASKRCARSWLRSHARTGRGTRRLKLRRALRPRT